MTIITCAPVLKEKQLECGMLDCDPGRDTVQTHCQNCATPIYIGPNSRAALKLNTDICVLCPQCVAPFIAEHRAGQGDHPPKGPDET